MQKFIQVTVLHTYNMHVCGVHSLRVHVCMHACMRVCVCVCVCVLVHEYVHIYK